VLIGEPAPTQADLHFTLFGIPVRVHPFFWLVALLLGWRVPDAGALVTWIVAVFVGVLVHELGHAAVMRRFGFQPWITLYGLGGLASYNPRYGSRGPDTWGQVLISAAGPVAGFLAAGAIVGLLMLAGIPVEYDVGAPTGFEVFPTAIIANITLTRLVTYLLFVTIVYGILNLMPIYPLDGGHIARELFLYFSPRSGIRNSLTLSMIVAGGLAVMGLINGDYFVALLFGYLAFMSFQTLQAYTDRRSW